MTKRLSTNWPFLFLVPIIACIVCLDHFSTGHPTTWDFWWATLALLFMTVRLMQIFLRYRAIDGEPIIRRAPAEAPMVWRRNAATLSAELDIHNRSPAR